MRLIFEPYRFLYRPKSGWTFYRLKAGFSTDRRPASIPVDLGLNILPAEVRLQYRSEPGWTFYRFVYLCTNTHVPSPYILNLILLITYKLNHSFYIREMNLMKYTMKRYSKLSYHEFLQNFITHST